MSNAANARITRKAKEDLLKDSQMLIKNPNTTSKWLKDNELTPKGENVSLPTLAAALFQLCSGRYTLPRDMVTGMRAIAICMEGLLQERHTTEASDLIKDQVEEIIKETREAINGFLGEMRAAIKDTEDRMKKYVAPPSEVLKMIEKAVHLASKPTYTQALNADHNARIATKDLQIRNNAEI